MVVESALIPFIVALSGFPQLIFYSRHVMRNWIRCLRKISTLNHINVLNKAYSWFFYTNLLENLLTYVLVNIKTQNLTKLLFEVLYLFFSVISNDAAYKKLAFLLLNFGISWDTCYFKETKNQPQNLTF